MKEQIYEIRLTEINSVPIEQHQTTFMNDVFKLAQKSGLFGYGLEIVRLIPKEVRDDE